MTRLTLCLVTITASIGLTAGQSPQEATKSRLWPWEVQLDASFMGYDSHKATWTSFTTEFSAKNPRLAPSIRLSLDPISLPFGSILFSAGYRLGNDVPLEYMGRDARSDLSHSGQLQLGALLRFEASKYLEFEVGVDARSDSMKASKLAGTESESSEWRPWVRANARYMFNKWEDKLRWPFIGVEVAYALSSVEVNSSNYYHDYAINTGDIPLGPVGATTSPNSFTKGNFPSWEVALMGGIRFGKHGVYYSKPKTPKATNEVVPKPANEAVEAKKVDEVKPTDADAETRRLAEEARRRDEEARRQAEEARRREEEARRREEEARRQPVTETTRRIADIEAVMLHFVTNGYTETREDRALVRAWVAKYKNSVDSGELLVVGHCDNTGTWEKNKTLSVQRANALANLLKAEGINVPAANVTGESFDNPIADNNTPEGKAKNRRVELRIRNARANSVIEGKLAGVR